MRYADLRKDTYAAVVKRSRQWWIGWIEEVPGVNCQEATQAELSLDFNRREALDAAGEGFDEESIAL
jgi:hypothetical protein